MAVIKVTDIAYARLRSPDLDLQSEFLENFGLVQSAKTNNAIYYRGTDPVHHLHITEKGEPKFIGIAYHAASEDDLKTLAKVPGASGIENLDEPGGGKRVRVTEPNGYQIEVVWGMDKVPEIPAPRQLLNSGYAPLARKGDLHARRQAISILQHPDKGVIYKLFEEIAPRYTERPGGYTRILKLGARPGDATELVYLELV